MLHVTNGASVSLDRSGLGGEVLAWIDVLHEGPVPAGLGLDDLSRLRGKFLDGAWPGPRPAAETLSNRDAALGRFTGHDEVVLWFEHDLYDQLQLIQILDWFHGRRVPRLSLICIDDYLGRLTGPQLARLWPSRHTVTVSELHLAAAAWHAFRAPDPIGIEELLRGDTSALPFLAGALLRHLQQFPSLENGLSRTERQILGLVDAGKRNFACLFAADRQREERIFMGDASFARYVSGLCDCRHPLLVNVRGAYDLTPTGRDVLASRADSVRLNGINRWLGGVHLSGAEALWRWDERRRRLAPH
ncbi:RNA polymerase, sigma-24 subunit, ECF subfamily [Candidatus Sulfopaludibacter sp. SbA6]|nr:RNA polymerase, sigma-24 subunit, ECF subfamily [Candidatus Sulfopaludibacter sp. SbA6]